MTTSTRQLLELHDDEQGCEVPGNDWQRHPYAELHASVDAVQSARVMRAARNRS